jgi:hypothetical protein
LIRSDHGLYPEAKRKGEVADMMSFGFGAVRCGLLGHRFRFSNDGDNMRWRCQRGCGAVGAKRYPTAEDAHRYARAFDREDLGRRAPLFGLFPLRLLHAVRKSRRDGAECPS